MSQNDLVIANASGATVRADINSALQALASASSGATAPSTDYPYQWWFDTTLNILKIRNAAGTAWVNAASLVGSTWKLYEQGTLLLDRANGWSAVQTLTGGLVGPSTQAKGTDYTVLPADAYATLAVDASGAARTITLPAAATAGAGFEVGVYKSDSSANAVIVDANGAETIDAPGGTRLSVNLPSQFDRLRLISRGSKWATLDHRLSFESAAQTITAAGLLTLAHGLGVKPDKISVRLKCVTAQGNYSVNDEVPVELHNVNSAVSGDKGQSIVADATNLNIRYGSNSTTYDLLNKTTGQNFAITNANWNAIFSAEL